MNLIIRKMGVEVAITAGRKPPIAYGIYKHKLMKKIPVPL